MILLRTGLFDRIEMGGPVVWNLNFLIGVTSFMQPSRNVVFYIKLETIGIISNSSKYKEEPENNQNDEYHYNHSNRLTQTSRSLFFDDTFFKTLKIELDYAINSTKQKLNFSQTSDPSNENENIEIDINMENDSHNSCYDFELDNDEDDNDNNKSNSNNNNSNSNEKIHDLALYSLSCLSDKRIKDVSFFDNFFFFFNV